MPLSTREQNLVNLAKQFLPANFVAKEDDNKVAAYLELALADMNVMNPPTAYTVDTMPPTWDSILAFGGTMYANLFLQVNYSLKDFTYSDYGLSLNVDRHGKLGIVYDKQLRAYERMIWNAKKVELLRVMPAGLGAPRFQSQIGQFLKTVFGSTFNWSS